MNLFFRYRYLLLFILLAAIGFYLRFHAIHLTQGFGWDQARDAWKVRDLLHGQLVLDGPKTGTGGMHIGPLYFYFLAPFFFLTGLDPVASNYSVMVSYLINICVFFFITRKLFGDKTALAGTAIWVFSFYLIHYSQVQWNVSFVPSVSILIYYGIYQIYQKKYYWFPFLAVLAGLFFHLHFTFMFIPPIILLSLLGFRDFRNAIKYIIPSFFIYLLFFIPTIIFDIKGAYGETNRLKDFNNSYAQTFHFRFFLHRLPQSLVQFQAILLFKQLEFLKFILPLIFFPLVYLEKDKKIRLLGLLMLPWFIVPVIGFTLYKGEVSDYYFLLHTHLVIYILLYLMYRLIKLNKFVFIPLLTLFWMYYTIMNVKILLELPKDQGIDIQREDARETVVKSGTISFNEGDIKAYFYQIWEDKKK